MSNTIDNMIGYGMDLYNPISNNRGNFSKLSGVSKIDNSLKVIISTSLGEVPMLYNLGSNIDKYLFESNNEVLAEKVRIELEDSISRLEPRISILETEVIPEDNYLFISVIYLIKRTNITHKFDYTITKQTGGDDI